MDDVKKIKDGNAPSDSKQVVQSYMVTVAGRDWSLYAEKFLLKLVEIAQSDIKGLNFKEGKDTNMHKPSLNYPRLQINAVGDAIVSIPVSELTLEEGTHNYKQIRDAIMRLQKELIYWESPLVDSRGNVRLDKKGEPIREWTSVSLVQKANGVTGPDGTITVRIDTDIWKAVLDFSQGFRAFDLGVAMKLKSKYSLRLYQLVSRQKYPLSLSVEEIRKMWRLNDKYKRINDLKKYVLDKAKAELDSCSPWTFEYEFQTQKKGRGHPAVTSVLLIPVHQLKFDNPKNIVRENPGAFGKFGLTIEQAEAFKKKFGLDEQGIRNNHELIEKLCKSPLDVDKTIDTLSERVDRLRPEKVPGYVINSIKGMLKALEIDD